MVCAMLRDNKAMQLSLRSLFLDGNSITDPHMDVLGLLQNLQNLVIMRGARNPPAPELARGLFVGWLVRARERTVCSAICALAKAV